MRRSSPPTAPAAVRRTPTRSASCSIRPRRHALVLSVYLNTATLQAELDVRLGGRYRISFIRDDGEYFEAGGHYREVVPNELLVFTWAWHSTPERESLVTISLKPDGAGTLMVFHHAQFFDETARDNHERGWSSFLDKLDAFVA
ncbi:SRPBCC family protein [Bradyrhizobium liaoningense]|uniref:SRPBCC family protein n=1 Tax=Bradyrhizobium liaoningense TaxID=43992 RepID=UPI0032221865